MSTDITVKQEDVPFDVSFKSTLPPRKRAKTEEEKEQRRVERILRNRRAAHASREKKRKHVEYLEAYVLELENKLQQVQTNFDAVYAKLSPQQVADLGELSSVSVCSDLKDKISTNLTGSKKIEVKEEFVSSPSETPTTNNNKRSYDEVAAADEEDSMSVQDTTYYNYLSPVSINSPINSPIDLTLTSNPESLSPQNSYGLMEQSSAHRSKVATPRSAAPAIPEFDGFNEVNFTDMLSAPSEQASPNLDQALDIEEFLAL